MHHVTLFNRCTTRALEAKERRRVVNQNLLSKPLAISPQAKQVEERELAILEKVTPGQLQIISQHHESLDVRITKKFPEF